jgi:predicted oxidoreductase (fatty acid repression mutant protein)
VVNRIILPASHARRSFYNFALKVIISLDIFTSIIEKTILANDTTGNSTSLEDVVNVFETHVRSFWEEEVGDWNNDAQVENCKQDITVKVTC